MWGISVTDRRCDSTLTEFVFVFWFYRLEMQHVSEERKLLPAVLMPSVTLLAATLLLIELATLKL